MIEALRQRLNEPVDASGLALFRILFGALMTYAVVRFWANGWIEEIYLDPDVHFTYLGFSWVRPLPDPWIYLQFTIMGVAAVWIALGYRTRLAAGTFFVLFTWAELIEKAAYLNHYYFVSIAALLLVFVPSDAALSLRARRDGEQGVGRWAYGVLRAQVAIVYFFAGFAKLNGDWLFRARTTAHVAAVLRPLAGRWWVADAGGNSVRDELGRCGVRSDDLDLALEQADPTVGLRGGRRVPCERLGAVSDRSVLVGDARQRHDLLRARLAASLAASVGRTRGGRGTTAPASRHPGARGGRRLADPPDRGYPLRHIAYPGWVNWTEEGFRFAWRVMLVEKTGQVEYRVVAADPPLEVRVFPRDDLTELQFRMLSTQPDMIHEYALILAEDYRARGYSEVEVFADVWIAFNGRISQRAIDPDVDLAAQTRSLRHATWILPLEASDPGQ